MEFKLQTPPCSLVHRVVSFKFYQMEVDSLYMLVFKGISDKINLKKIVQPQVFFTKKEKEKEKNQKRKKETKERKGKKSQN